ncbi:MAG: ParB/RepB/Spo0J family partition protein [Desulfofustis sp.]|nr:ParB/RepB/Spo0J family partition protein [Desulfofustis sp.]NNF46119.1 ParB/RepB/Spo0J family partition protein [Desulfofustis sp.]NNK56589.1 ParB/RepB/Spo0J family partition protein [Desulfofustis sp.]
MAKLTGLDGQGISALFGEQPPDESYFECGISQITPNKHQPRMMFDQEELTELANSIRENGVIQPLIVSRSSKKKFTLIAGERRLRASKIAGLKTVPVIVRELSSDDELLEFALIENIQRTDLNPLEEAEAYRKLIDKFGLTQEEAAKKVGKNRSTVANSVRLLQLPDYIKDDLLSGRLTEGHARALLAVLASPATMKEIRDQIVAKQLSVRLTEKLIKTLTREVAPTKASFRTKDKEFSKSVKKSFENQLTNRLSSQVFINQKGSRGKIEIEYYSYDDLERIIAMVVG